MKLLCVMLIYRFVGVCAIHAEDASQELSEKGSVKGSSRRL